MESFSPQTKTPQLKKELESPNPVCSAALANDVARCNGVGFQEDDGWDWREGCETCLRRTAARGGKVWMIKPPAIIAFECEFLIPP